MFTGPKTFREHTEYGSSDFRKDNKLAEGDLSFKVVDIHGVRLYCVIYPMAKMPGSIGVWQHTGTGLSTRAAEDLLKYIEDDFAIVEWSGDLSDVPPPTYLPEGEVHGNLRTRIRDLLHRQPLEPEKVQVTESDVYLYQTGMAAIHRLSEVLVQRDPSATIVLGAIFHNTWHVFEEFAGGIKHFGPCGATSGVLDEVETFLSAHYGEGKTISSVFVEFPSNPLLVSVDLRRLRAITNKYAIPLVVDETISSFASVDVLPVADLVISSLTKSFSGYANVMGGSVVVNPISPHYAELKPLFDATFHNELFIGDAETLLSNSADYFARTTILNRNAVVLAEYLATAAADKNSSVTGVHFPTTSDTRANYEPFMRPKKAAAAGEEDSDFAPGYGCLLSIDFTSIDTTKAFYDNLQIHSSPHLGAHRTLALIYNAVIYGKTPEEATYHASYGLKPEQIRISVGLEDEEEILAAVKAALAKADEAYVREKETS